MKKMRSLMALVLIGVLCISLCACGISKAKAVGTWSGSYVYNGNTFSVSFVLTENGTYSKATYKNGEFYETETGTWEIKGSKVLLHENGNLGGSTPYKYKNGALVNNDHEFYKQ